MDLGCATNCTLSINLLSILARNAGKVKTRRLGSSAVGCDCGAAVLLWLHMMALPPPASSARADRLAFFMLKSVNKALREHAMIANGDRVLVAVSGGKDSLALLDLLDRRRRSAAERYDLVAGHVRSDHHCGRGVPEDWLRSWCRERSISFACDAIRVAAVVEGAGSSEGRACFVCARRRRRAILELARQHGCTTVALGHHADDLAETALMNLFYNARLETMAPVVSLFEGTFRLIRPLAYVEERDIVTFARASGYPLAGEPCPDGERSRRALVRRLLHEVESSHPAAKRCILSAAARRVCPRTASHREEDNRVRY